MMSDRCQASSERTQLPEFRRLYLKGQVFRIHATLGQATGNEPQALLRRPLEHVGELAIRPDAPDGTDAFV
jgi:hypothetical protein